MLRLSVASVVRRLLPAALIATPFMRLRNAAELMPGNASRTYLEIEPE